MDLEKIIMLPKTANFGGLVYMTFLESCEILQKSTSVYDVRRMMSQGGTLLCSHKGKKKSWACSASGSAWIALKVSAIESRQNF